MKRYERRPLAVSHHFSLEKPGQFDLVLDFTPA